MRATPSRHHITEPTSVAGIIAVLALGIGILSALSPVVGAAAGLMSGVLAFLTLGKRIPLVFLKLLGICLAGYAFLGRGFAYLGAPPVYVGEVILALALLSLVIVLPRATRLGILHYLVCAFVIWGGLQTVPYFSSYGLDALRDGVLWAYAVIGVAVSLAVRPRHFDSLIAWYGKLLPLFLLWVPIAWALYRLYPFLLPFIPGSNVPLLVFKGGDVAVHLTAVAVFVVFGLYTRRHTAVVWPTGVLWLLWIIGCSVTISGGRAAMLAILGGLAGAFLLHLSGSLLASGRIIGRWYPLVTTLVVAFVLIWLIDPKIHTGGRDVSLEQVTDNVRSIFSQTETEHLEGSKGWRLEWWDTIMAYTFHGPYFWTGKGFGINLADDDGFQVGDGRLRSPHSVHMTVLARMGVPGFVLWIMLQVTFALALIFAFYRAQREGDLFWAQINVWLLFFWLALMINASFDVYFEGPQGGIWFWSVVGLGLAALRLQQEARSSAQSHQLSTRQVDAYPVRP